MTDEKKTLTSKDFGLNLTELPKEKKTIRKIIKYFSSSCKREYSKK